MRRITWRVSSSTGQSLIDHGGLDKLSFTGSGVAGQKMLTASAQHLRPTSLELGGKSPVVVFDDARTDHSSKERRRPLF